MELHCEEGTQRLELPVSRTTLNDWGGVPREISEKSRYCQQLHLTTECDYIHCAFKKLVTGTG